MRRAAEANQMETGYRMAARGFHRLLRRVVLAGLVTLVFGLFLEINPFCAAATLVNRKAPRFIRLDLNHERVE